MIEVIIHGGEATIKLRAETLEEMLELVKNPASLNGAIEGKTK